MNFYICEDTVPGLLTAVFYAYYNKEAVDCISAEKNGILLGDTAKEIEADNVLARRVRDGIKKIDSEAYHKTELVFCSDTPDRLNIIYQYLRLLFKTKEKLTDKYAAHSEVRTFEDIAGRVMHEAHRMTGFIRFQELKNGVMYAHYSSDNDVIMFIMPHFAERFNTEKFIIHDVKRNNAAVCENGSFYITKIEGEVELELSDSEDFYLSLWRQYINNVTISSRRNIKLQDGFMPKRYRWFMNEYS